MLSGIIGILCCKMKAKIKLEKFVRQVGCGGKNAHTPTRKQRMGGGNATWVFGEGG